LIISFFNLLLFLLTEMFALRLVSRHAVVSPVEGVAGSGRFEVLKKVLSLVNFKLTAVFGSVDTFAWGSVLHSSFLVLCNSIVVSESFKINTAETLFEVEAIINLSLLESVLVMRKFIVFTEGVGL